MSVAVKVSRDDISNTNMKAAFGPDSLGIILIDGLGEKYKQLRLKVLESARVLGNLTPDALKQLQVPETSYQTGWSRGIEKLESGKPDTYKGSFYVNCNFTRTGLDQPDPQTVEHFPSPLNCYPNVWPSIPDFEKDLKELISFMVEVVVEVADACDKTLEMPLKHSLADTLKNSDVCRARLLHYYKTAEEGAEWCGDHLDHSCLTALTSALWGPTQTTEPEGEAGLYIRSRDGTVVKAQIPDDCIAIQSGSALEVMTNGSFKAVLHRVVGDSSLYRSTLAVFCQPRLEDMVGDCTFSEYSERIIRGFN